MTFKSNNYSIFQVKRQSLPRRIKIRYHDPMKRRYSQLIGLPLVVRDSPVKLGRVFNLFMDPDKGILAAIQTTHAQVIAPVDLGEFKGDAWEVRDEDAPIHELDLVRLQTISKERRTLIRKQVITKDGTELGRVDDFMLDMATLSLTQLHVIKRGWLFRVVGEHLINRRQILEITDHAVIVKNQHVKGVKELESYWQLKEMGMPIPSH